MNTRHTALSIALVLLVAAVAPATVAAAPVSEDAVGDVTVTAAPASAAASAAAEGATTTDPSDSIIASSDVAIVRLNASGIPAEADDDGTLLGDELTVSLQQTSSSVGTNETAKTLDASADSEGVAVNATSDAVYVAIDLQTATFQQGNGTATAAAGDSFTASATVTDEVTDGENYTRQTTFGVVEPSVNFVDDVSESPAGEVVNYQAATTLAPGTTLTFSLVSGHDAEEGAANAIEATVDKNSRMTVQFSFFTYEADEEYSISVSAEDVELGTTWTGTTVATGTPTPEPTDTPTETSTSTPGFGVVAALLAIVGAGALVRRE